MTKTEEARRLASCLRTLTPANYADGKALDDAAASLRTLADEVERLEQDIANTIEYPEASKDDLRSRVERLETALRPSNRRMADMIEGG